MIIQRDKYLQKIIAHKWNGKVKIITGIRRCGKSFLLFNLYKQHLLETGIKEDHIIEVALDRKEDAAYRNPIILGEYVLSKASNKDEQYYVFIDEIQMSYKVKNSEMDENSVPEEDRDLLYTTFYDTLNDLMSRKNLDVYVTGSNSKMLSSDIATYFRDRGSEIRVYPLSFNEFYSYFGGEKADAFEEYLTYGGMPLAVLEKDEAEKRSYLNGLHKRVYLKDIVERHKLKDYTILDALVDSLYSAVGSLTNTHKQANTAGSRLGMSTSDHTIKNYLDYLEDAYLFKQAKRYDVKGRKYYGSPLKYYATDIGLRNAKLNFRQQDRSHLMENIIFNELVSRGFAVDVGVVELTAKDDNGKQVQSQHEIDFIVNTGSQKIYIQSALNVDTQEKKDQETCSLKNSGDFFRKIVVLEGNQKLWTDDDGISYVGVVPFLLDENLL